MVDIRLEGVDKAMRMFDPASVRRAAACSGYSPAGFQVALMGQERPHERVRSFSGGPVRTRRKRQGRTVLGGPALNTHSIFKLLPPSARRLLYAGARQAFFRTDGLLI